MTAIIIIFLVFINLRTEAKLENGEIKYVYDKSLTTHINKDHPLNPDYSPNIININKKYACKYISEEIKVDYRIVTPLEEFLEFLGENKVDVCITSGYRSYYQQECLYYGESRKQDCENRSKVDTATLPGLSEHQLGFAVDLRVIGDINKGYEFIKQHALDFGFIQSYPKGNSYDLGNGKKGIYEDWHWRYIGKENINLFKKYGDPKDPQKFLENYKNYQNN